MYELLRSIGANFKMSDIEFTAKVTYFKKLHEKCGTLCNHIDYFLKKIIFQNHLNRTIP